MVINVTNMTSRKKVEGSDGSHAFMYNMAGDIINQCKTAGWIFFDDIIWDKDMGASQGTSQGKSGGFLWGSYPYPPTPKISNSVFEQLLVFCKDGSRIVDKEIKEQSKLTFDEWKEFTHGIWKIRTDRDQFHPATFPIELAERVIRLYSFVGDVVLDPFAGSGTTIVAADKWKRKGIGFEIAPEYTEAVLNKEYKNKTLFS